MTSTASVTSSESGPELEALRQHFKSCSAELLSAYRNRYLQGDPTLDTMERIADALTSLFGNRKKMRGILEELDKAHHLALIALIQSGGVAGGTWLLQELCKSHDRTEDAWLYTLHDLGRALLIFGNSRQAPPLFYVMPRAIMDLLSPYYRRRLQLPGVTGEIRMSKDTNYRHPVGFSLVSYLTYLEQKQVRITQKTEIFKKNLEEMLAFFSHLWGAGEAQKVFDWHRGLLEDLGLVVADDGLLTTDRSAVSEWLSIPTEARRNLYLDCFARQEPLIEWLLQRLAEIPPDQWVPLKPLNLMYRRSYMGSVFHKRFVRKTYYLPPSGFYNPNPPMEYIQLAGLVERGLGPEGSYVRLSDAGRAFLEGAPLGETLVTTPVKFYVQPNFEILAPAGMDLASVYRIGQIAEITAVDRMNTYTLTHDSVRDALDRGWRREELMNFLSGEGTVGLPQNVRSTIEDWVGDHGEVEFHDALVVTVRNEKEEAFVDLLRRRRVPMTRLGPGVYTLPREERETILKTLRGKGFEPSPWVRKYDKETPDGPPTRLRELVGRLASGESRGTPDGTSEAAEYPARQLVILQPPSAETTAPEEAREGTVALNGDGRAIASMANDLTRKPGAAGKGDILKLSPTKTADLLRAAISRSHDVEILYRTASEESITGSTTGLIRVTPRSLRDHQGVQFLEGLDHKRGLETQFIIKRIHGIRLAREK